MKMEPIVITMNVHVDGENPHVAKEFAERLMKAMGLPTVAEQDAWVELNGYWRISTDGVKVQRRDWCDDSDPWVDTTEAPELVKLYRTGLAHGREVAQAEHEALREQVRALVEAVETAEQHDKDPMLYYKISTRLWNHVLQTKDAVQL